MRRFIACIAATFLVAAIPQPGTAAEVSVDFFYTSLEPHGEWVEAADYGYVWHPRDIAEDWRPYTEGSWAYTDAGWTWVSDEPHGAITYHYGRWVELADVGWSWVPDTEWAPAWVSWRRSEKHVGWAPLPPEARFRREVGIKTWSDTYYDVGPTHYTFVEVRNLGAPKIRSVIVPPRENVTIIRETRNITNITVQNNIVFVGGPEYDVVVRESAEPIRRLRIERRTDVVFERDSVRADAFRPEILGGALRVVAPEVTITRDLPPPRRVARRIERVEVNRGWRDLGQQAEQVRAVMSRETAKAPAELPPKPRFVPVRERVAENARGENAPAQAGQAPADAAAGNRERMRERNAAGQAGTAAPAGDLPPTTTAPGTPTAPSDKPAATTERPAAGKGRRPGDPATARATETERPDAPPTAGSGKGKNRDGKRSGPPTDPATAGTPDTAPPTTSPERPSTAGAPDAASGNPEDEGKTRLSRGKAPAAAKDGAATTPAGKDRDATTPPAAKDRDPAASPTGTSDATQPDAKDGKMRDRKGRAAGEPPASSDRRDRDAAKPASTDRPDRPARPPGTPDRRGAAADRPDRPGAPAERPDRPEATADRPDRPERPERPARPDAGAPAPKSAGPDGADRPNRPDRPARPEGAAERSSRPDAPERPARTERPDAPAGGSGADRDGVGRGGRPDGAGPAGAGRPDAPAGARGEGKRGGGERDAGKKGAADDRKAGE